MKVIVLLLLLVKAPLLANPLSELRFKPIKVGDGPILSLYHPETSEGKPSAMGKGRREVLYLYDPTLHQSPQRLWIEGSNPGRPHPLARVKGEWMIMEYCDRSFALRLSEGSILPLLPGESKTEVIAVEEDHVFFLQKTAPEKKRGGYSLGRGPGDTTVVIDYHRPRDFLYGTQVDSENSAKLLTKIPIEEVIAIDEKGIWVITAGNDRRLGIISRSKGFQAITTITPHWVASSSKFKISPDGKHAAISYVDDRDDFHQVRSVAILNVETKSLDHHERKVELRWGALLSFPKLQMNWINNSQLACGEQILDLQEKRFVKSAPIGSSSIIETEFKKRKTYGFFDKEFGLLFYKGASEPVANILTAPNSKGSHTAICPDGKYAVFLSPETKNFYLVNGAKHKKSLLLEGWGYDHQWLPSIEKSYRRPKGFLVRE